MRGNGSGGFYLCVVSSGRDYFFIGLSANVIVVLIIAIIVGASVGWCKATDHC